MSREINPGDPTVVTDDLQEDTSKPINKTQFPNFPCDPAAIHDLYPPISIESITTT